MFIPKAAGQQLLDALLQCDGSRLQAIVMVRDDFWMATTRFFRDLDVRLVDGQNRAAVDLQNKRIENKPPVLHRGKLTFNLALHFLRTRNSRYN